MAVGLVPGCHVDVIRGKYKGDSGVVERLTPKMVWVSLRQKRSSVWVYQSSVEPSHVPDSISTSQRPAPDSAPGSSRYNRSTLLPPPAQHTSNEDVAQAQWSISRDQAVNVVGGKYRGQKGTVVSQTPKMVYVKLKSGKMVRIMKTSVEALQENNATPQLPSNVSPVPPLDQYDNETVFMSVGSTAHPVRNAPNSEQRSIPARATLHQQRGSNCDETDSSFTSALDVNETQDQSSDDSLYTANSQSSQSTVTALSEHWEDAASCFAPSSHYFTVANNGIWNSHQHQSENSLLLLTANSQASQATSPHRERIVPTRGEVTIQTANELGVPSFITAYGAGEIDDASVVTSDSGPVCPLIITKASAKSASRQAHASLDADLVSCYHTTIESIFGASGQGHLALEGRNDRTRLLNGFDVESITLPGSRSSKPKSFAEYLFRNRLLTVTLEAKSNKYCHDRVPSRPNIRFVQNGYEYHLLLSKYHRDSKRLSVRYVLVKGNGVPEIDLESTLNGIGNFGMLIPRKCASRLELFNSRARRSPVKEPEHLIIDSLKTNDFELVDENCHEGCGFIPRSYLDRFLGHTESEKTRKTGIQVRIFCPRLGIFKGLLTEKPNISKIQLPSSMRKVGASITNNRDFVCLVITEIFPSPGSEKMAKYLDPTLTGKPFKPKLISPMITDLWTSKGVSQQQVVAYRERAAHPSNLKHAYLIGVADATGMIPQGYVFVPGLDRRIRYVVLTRCPCMIPSDIVKVPVLRRRPSSMSDREWKWMNQSLPFGSVIFGNSNAGNTPMPNCIADSDLDGDKFCVCWDDEIVSSISSPLYVPKVEHPSPQPKSIPSRGWLSKAQAVASNISGMLEMNILIGVLYHASKEQASCSAMKFNDPDAIELGKAMKKAIDFQKHGGKVLLPSHLWAKVYPKKLQKHLVLPTAQIH